MFNIHFKLIANVLFKILLQATDQNNKVAIDKINIINNKQRKTTTSPEDCLFEESKLLTCKSRTIEDYLASGFVI